MMAIDRAKASLNFAGGIDAVSRVNQESTSPPIPSTKKIIYFNEDASPSKLSQLFRCFRGKHLVDKFCKPSKVEFEALRDDFQERRGVDALHWVESLDSEIDPKLKSEAESVLRQIAELEIKENVQRNLLQRV